MNGFQYPAFSGLPVPYPQVSPALPLHIQIHQPFFVNAWVADAFVALGRRKIGLFTRFKICQNAAHKTGVSILMIVSGSKKQLPLPVGEVCSILIFPHYDLFLKFPQIHSVQGLIRSRFRCGGRSRHRSRRRSRRCFQPQAAQIRLRINSLLYPARCKPYEYPQTASQQQYAYTQKHPGSQRTALQASTAVFCRLMFLFLLHAFYCTGIRLPGQPSPGVQASVFPFYHHPVVEKSICRHLSI